MASRSFLGGWGGPFSSREAPPLPNFGQPADPQRDRAGQSSPNEPEMAPVKREDSVWRSPLDEGHGCLRTSLLGISSLGSVRKSGPIWTSLKSLRFPPLPTLAVRTATLVQHLEADFTRRLGPLGTISAAAANDAKAVIAGLGRKGIYLFLGEDASRPPKRIGPYQLLKKSGVAQSTVNVQLQPMAIAGIWCRCCDITRQFV